ncbi:hypothetical protein EBESD8_46150 [Rhodococcus aetherivorans]|nr:hypothetical protein EBESD8_46150 [Rhodococcus aetherivorans]
MPTALANSDFFFDARVGAVSTAPRVFRTSVFTSYLFSFAGAVAECHMGSM